MKTLKVILEQQIEHLQKKVDENKSKLMENFTYHYEWGYADDVVATEHKIKGLTNLLNYVNDGEKTVNEWLEYNIKTIEKEILSGRFTQSSTNKTANNCFEIKKKVDCELREMYIDFLNEITDTKEPLQIK